MRSMLERERSFTPVTASVVDRHVLARGSQEKVINNITRKDREERPDLVVLTPTCTSSILQEDLKNFVHRASLNSKSDVLLADVNHYRVNELQAADKTLLQIVRFYLDKYKNTDKLSKLKTPKPSVNIIGSVGLGFHNHHDMVELKRLFLDLGIDVNLIIPEGITVEELCKITQAWFNFVPYKEIGLLTAQYLQSQYNLPFINIIPMGTIQISSCIKAIQNLLFSMGQKVDYSKYIDRQTRFISQSAWFSRSIDCQNLTGKKAVVFGDATHASAITRILSSEMSIRVIWSGTYCLNESDWFKNQVKNYCDQVVITDDHTLVADLIVKADPNAIFGTQMERHVGKRISVPCGVISSPVHIQNFPLSYRPFLGYEGTNQIADLVYNSFTLGMEDHLLEFFGGHDTKQVSEMNLSSENSFSWSREAKEELAKIPGFVRNRVKKNTERFACANSLDKITVQVMYKAKESQSL
uniref:Light-independent protochlorophyllide reductase subunit B n=1 Tax=Porolithon onkodes TaxID=231751 RepID=A0A2Z2KSP1_9FLOR|nr:putative group II intron reverse transcriptase/maturase protein [Porolithon onkodes]ASB29819.1 putative group II intron reverse transcriptase/maturase protein [Porolithon onkodes]